MLLAGLVPASPLAAVFTRGAAQNVTTDRSTSPWPILAKASST